MSALTQHPIALLPDVCSRYEYESSQSVLEPFDLHLHHIIPEQQISLFLRHQRAPPIDRLDGRGEGSSRIGLLRAGAMLLRIRIGIGGSSSRSRSRRIDIESAPQARNDRGRSERRKRARSTARDEFSLLLQQRAADDPALRRAHGAESGQRSGLVFGQPERAADFAPSIVNLQGLLFDLVSR